jgi:hypothetical protein
VFFCFGFFVLYFIVAGQQHCILFDFKTVYNLLAAHCRNIHPRAKDAVGKGMHIRGESKLGCGRVELMKTGQLDRFRENFCIGVRMVDGKPNQTVRVLKYLQLIGDPRLP